MKNQKIQKGKEFEKELRANAPATERRFKQLINQIKKAYQLKFTMNFQKGWYKDEAFFISDFYFPQTKVSIELDGASHDSAKQKAQDARKEAYLMSIGVKTARLKNQEVWSMDYEKLFRFLIRSKAVL